MPDLLHDARVRRLLFADLASSAASGVTLIAVPWMLIRLEDGPRLYGYAALGTTIALFLFMPYYGVWLDRFRRRTMLLAGEAFGCAAMTAAGCWALAAAEPSPALLVTAYFGAMLYSTLHYPAKFAYVQETFRPRHYAALTGLTEIQGQTAAILAGAVASLVVGRAALPVLLFAHAAAHLLGLFVQRGLPSRPRRPARVHRSAWHAMAAGGRWLLDQPRLCTFLLCTYVPFVVAMAGAYLFPIYVDRLLQAPAAVLGRGEMLAAVSALAAGIVVPRLVPLHGADRVLIVTLSVFVGGLLVLALLPATPLYYTAALLLGLGVAGSRVARGALVLTLVPAEVLGRVQMFFSAFDRVLRTVLIVAAAAIVERHDAALGFGAFALAAALALAGMLASRQAVRFRTGAMRPGASAKADAVA